MRQYSGYATAADTNERFRYLLEQGQTGLSVAFDLPTQIGYDSDHPLSKGEVGKVGVPICSLGDMETLFHGIPLGQTAGVSLTAQQPDNNVIRCTVQALAAILGGSQSLHVNSRDEALALPSEESAQLSLRTQQILAFESGTADVVDPLGGSWYIESLTNDLEAQAWITFGVSTKWAAR
ncbi:Methylmalonyl-CoA mutase [Geodia barretti]|uniref:Methylmalonyl-CoA mutase n=1 Tax=Geodia barretti TaxID=519541 RepID=A0AA35XB01_GEOBA|nr:Methylmalonyl-CoA mutase [Geodia barretti]